MVSECVELLERIERMKKKLVLTVQITGFDSQDTLACSQELDQLIVNYQKLSK